VWKGFELHAASLHGSGFDVGVLLACTQFTTKTSGSVH
jgi:hypothetical protein